MHTCKQFCLDTLGHKLFCCLLQLIAQGIREVGFSKLERRF